MLDLISFYTISGFVGFVVLSVDYDGVPFLKENTADIPSDLLKINAKL